MLPIDSFIKNTEAVLQENSQPETKVKKLEELINVNREFLSEYKNPAYAEKVQNLATRISNIPVKERDLQERIKGVATTLTSFSEGFRLPSELMNLLVNQSVQEQSPAEAAALRLTSKETRRQAVEAFRGPLSAFQNIKTADHVLQFVKEFGPGLTYLNVEGIKFSQSQLEQIISQVPNLNTLIAKDCAIGVEGAKRIATLKNLHTLDLSENNIGDEGVIALANTLKNLKALNLSKNSVTDKGVKALADSEQLNNLQTLILCENQIGPDGAIAMARSQPLKNLQTLDLGRIDKKMQGSVPGNSIGAVGARAIAESQVLKFLQTLDLGGNSIGDEGALALSGTESLKALQILNLRMNGIGTPGAIAIAQSENLKQLQALDLSDNGIRDEGVKAIARSENVSQLKKLFLNGCGLTPAGAIAVADSENLKNLKELGLGQNFLLGDKGVMAIVRSKWLKNLQRLNLGFTKITGEGAFAIANAENLNNLEDLDLRANFAIGDQGCIAIASSKFLKNLKRLDLMMAGIGNAAVKAIADSENFHNLQELNLMNNDIGDDGAFAIARSRTLKNLKWLNLESCSIGENGSYAVRIRERLIDLTPAEWNQLEHNIYQLGIQDKGNQLQAMRDPEWGKHHLFDNFVRFADAFSRLSIPKREKGWVTKGLDHIPMSTFLR